MDDLKQVQDSRAGAATGLPGCKTGRQADLQPQQQDRQQHGLALLQQDDADMPDKQGTAATAAADAVSVCCELFKAVHKPCLSVELPVSPSGRSSSSSSSSSSYSVDSCDTTAAAAAAEDSSSTSGGHVRAGPAAVVLSSGSSRTLPPRSRNTISSSSSPVRRSGSSSSRLAAARAVPTAAIAARGPCSQG